MVRTELAPDVEQSEELKRCPKCTLEKSLDLFYKNSASTSKTKTSSWCKECTLKSQSDYNARNKEQISTRRAARYRTPEGKRSRRNSDWKKRYGVTYDEVEKILADQGDRCAICKTPIELGKHTHLDHQHVTGKVRGVLCVNCNLMIGHAKEDVSRLRSAIDYLAKGV